jgi:site-specific DNA recombinase
VRCAVYARKSTEEGLSQEFNSLDAQRECAEAYIQSQCNQGWIALPDRYDDGGFTGANLDRPALKRLLADIEARRIDCVVIYKVDRLSRSLFDFARLMQIFELHGVSFVSVTQQFNSSTPMGRLTLNILLSFAQFEREIISERTRDKIAAARRKGKWMGGFPVLGYDLDAGRRRLVVNETEAEQVREIFGLFLERRSLTAVLDEMQQRGWRTKSWTTRKGVLREGQAWDRLALVRLLSNVLYVGEVRHRGKIYAGEQPAIVDRTVWRQAQRLVQRRKEAGPERNRQGALLQGLLICAGCGKRMTARYTTRDGRRYPYYVCVTGQKHGRRACPGGQLSARRVEESVVRALYEVADQASGGALQRALPSDRKVWEELQRGEQHQIMAAALERISYDRRLQQARLLLRPEVTKEPAEEVLIRAGKKPLVQQIAPAKADPPSTPEKENGVPRITKLMALAVRFEELLQKGVVHDYADLARLGGVSGARITQLMNLRNLAPMIQERILTRAESQRTQKPLMEGALRRISGILDWREQIQRFEELCRLALNRKASHGFLRSTRTTRCDH